jgi:hypothetical protein
MTDSQQALFERLALRVAARTGLDLDTARTAVDDALVHRGEHLSAVRAEVAGMADEIAGQVRAAYRAMGQALRRACTAGGRAARAVDSAGTETTSRDETRAGIRDRGRGMRMTAHHPDLAALDRFLDALYDRPA